MVSARKGCGHRCPHAAHDSIMCRRVPTRKEVFLCCCQDISQNRSFTRLSQRRAMSVGTKYRIPIPSGAYLLKKGYGGASPQAKYMLHALLHDQLCRNHSARGRALAVISVTSWASAELAHQLDCPGSIKVRGAQHNIRPGQPERTLIRSALQ